MSEAWPARLSPDAAKALATLPPPVQETVRDVLAVAGDQRWAWPPWDPTDPEGEDLRVASVGVLTVVYWINRQQEHLYVLDVVWAG